MMGTNYYQRERPPCPTCGSKGEVRHIGKSSGGWCFTLHVYPEDGINDLDDWLKLLVAGNIYDEYEEELTFREMVKIITDRSWARKTTPYGYPSWEAFDRENGAVAGPNGLHRHQIDGCRCIGHGSGTWDICVGDFS
jgi:hypothetical protein